MNERTSNKKAENIEQNHRTKKSNSEQKTSNEKIEQTSNKHRTKFSNEDIETLKSMACDELFRLKRTQDCMQACIGVMQGYGLNLAEVYQASKWMMNAAQGLIDKAAKEVAEEVKAK